MSLSVGIVGLPNAGKSTLFNALASKRIAETAPRPFTTIDPHEAVVAVPDSNLDKLARIVSNSEESNVTLRSTLPPSEVTKKLKIVPASVTFIDIAGLVKGAHKGEGLGNQFLAKIREVDAIAHVVRSFSNLNVSHSHPSYTLGSLEQILEDIEIVNLELELGEVEDKPTIYVLNSDEDINYDISLYHQKIKDKFHGEVISLSAKLEEELIDLSEDERKKYLKEVGIDHSGLEKLIKNAYKLLDLISFYTIKGGQEVHAWSLKRGEDIIEAAKKVHTDFSQKFIKAEVINVEELLEIGGWKEAKEKGKVLLEGRDYIVQDKDVVEFKIGQ